MDINKEDFIAQHMPFIIKVVSDFTKSYVDINNSEELSIAFEAFHHAMEQFDESKGAFFSFAKTVMTNRLIDARRKEGNIIFLELDEDIRSEGSFEEQAVLREELLSYEADLKAYGIDFDLLTKHSPKHQDTRLKVIALSRELHLDPEIVEAVRKSGRLPITLITRTHSQTLKFVKTHQKMILAIMLAYLNRVQSITDWIEAIYERSCS